MEKRIKNFDIVLSSDELIENNCFYAGTGLISMENKTFHFQVEPQVKRRRNPLIYNGKFFRVRANKNGQIRFTSMFRTGTFLADSKKTTFRRAVATDLRAALVFISKFYGSDAAVRS